MVITDRQKRIDLFLDLLSQRILLLDGAMGTSIQKLNLSPADFGGEEFDGCNEMLNLTKPDIIESIHIAYLDAGSDIIETNSFGSSPLVLAEYEIADRAYEISKAAAKIARNAADKYWTDEKPRFVAASMGPTTKSLSLTGGATFDQMVDNFYTQMKGLWDGGADIIFLETAQDSLNLKAGGLALERLRKETGIEIPVMISGTIESMGTMLAGQNIESLAISLAHLKPISFGLNCATGPEYMTDHVRSLSNLTPAYVSVMPNAGLPDQDGHYHESPAQMAETMDRFARSGWVNIMGGCCGTTPEHIRALQEVARKNKPRVREVETKSYLSNIDYITIESENRPYLIAERTNVIGSKKFKDLIIAGQWDEAAEIARKQVRAGAAIIDVCLSNPDRDELSDMKIFLPILLKKVKAPIMIDSTDERVIEASLKMIQGKALINSINLENGEERFQRIVPLALRYGAALVVGTIDDDPNQGMGVTAERKLEIAHRSYELLTKKYGVLPQDIYFDALVFPVGTGDEQYIGAAEATIQAIKLIKQKYPLCKTTLGISNLSFGLPLAGREVLNSVFLYHAVAAGLDTAIVNAEKLQRYPSLSAEEKKLSEDLIFHSPENYQQVLSNFSAFYKDKKTAAATTDKRSTLPPLERVRLAIIEATREGLISDLEYLRENQKMSPLDIINGPLMEGMKEVGRQFADNRLIVAEVLQSAEVMKLAVSHLEQYMESDTDSIKGSLLLATVKGDVHDIGKNLVEIVLANNGYKIINLGIKIPSDKIIEAYRLHKPDYIGLSGLLVKSAHQMVATASDLKAEGIDVPLIVGGAALSQNFVTQKIAAVYKGVSIYAKDAMDGLDILNQLSDPATKDSFMAKWRLMGHLTDGEENTETKISESNSERVKLNLSYDYGLKKPSDLKTHILPGEGINQNQLWEEAFQRINPGMLYKRHLGFRGNTAEALVNKDPKFMQLKELVEECQQLLLNHSRTAARALFAFFPAYSQDNDIVILSNDRSREIERIVFPRQSTGWQLCAADFLAPRDSGKEDYIGMLITSTGFGVRDLADDLKNKGDYLKSHALQAVALEAAEGLAEYTHQKMRAAWGWSDPAGITLKDLFATKYHGIRLSFGYPACPELDDQAILWRLLDAENKIQVRLTEEMMMDPEASVSALVFQHPEGRYFAV